MMSKLLRICSLKDLTKTKRICNTARFAHYHEKKRKYYIKEPENRKIKTCWLLGVQELLFPILLNSSDMESSYQECEIIEL